MPRTGAYAVPGGGQLKGMQLAIGHINKRRSTDQKDRAQGYKEGVLGEQVQLVVADSGAKPNKTMQEQQKIHHGQQDHRDDRFDVFGGRGGADDDLAQREKVVYLVAISGSNDTTGKDSRALLFPPVLLRRDGSKRDRASDRQEFRQEPESRVHDAGLHVRSHRGRNRSTIISAQNAGWQQANRPSVAARHSGFQRCPTNIAHSGAEFIINVNWGRDAVLSIQQAKQFGLIPKMTLIIPYRLRPCSATGVEPKLTEGVLAATDFLVDIEDKYPLAKMFVK